MQCFGFLSSENELQFKLQMLNIIRSSHTLLFFISAWYTLNNPNSWSCVRHSARYFFSGKVFHQSTQQFQLVHKMKIKAVPVFQHFHGRIVSLQHSKSDKCIYPTSSCQHLKSTKLTFCLAPNKSTGTKILELRRSMRSISIDSADCQNQF